MPSEALSGFGTLLKMGDGATTGTEAFATIAEVKDIGGPKFSMDVLETTTHSSVGAFKEKVGALLDAGEVTFDVNFVPTTATHNPTTGLLKKLIDRKLTNFKLVWPDAASTTWSFAALVTGYEPGAPVTDLMTASITLTVSGKPTFS